MIKWHKFDIVVTTQSIKCNSAYNFFVLFKWKNAFFYTTYKLCIQMVIK